MNQTFFDLVGVKKEFLKIKKLLVSIRESIIQTSTTTFITNT